MLRFFWRGTDVATWLLDRFTAVVNTPAHFAFWIIFSLGWITIDTTLRGRFDDVNGAFPWLVLILTIVGFWIENAMKAQQANQQSAMLTQMDRLEQMAEEAARRDRDAARRDIVLADLVKALDATVDALAEHLDTCRRPKRRRATARPAKNPRRKPS